MSSSTPTMIIDSHSHWLPEKIIQNAHFYSPAWCDIESQLKAMDAAGVQRALLSYPTTDAHLKLGDYAHVARLYNDTVGKVIASYPGRFVGAAAMPIGDAADMLYEMQRAVKELGFRAVSLASSYQGLYLDATMFHPLYKRAEEDEIPIFVHSQIVSPIGSERVEDPLLTPVIEYVFDLTISVGKLLMSDVLRQFPRLKFVFAYFGGATVHLINRFDATYWMLRRIGFVKELGGDPSDFLKNIYVDTSGDLQPSNFSAALDFLGPEHILWGSDWPAKSDVGAAVKMIQAQDLSEGDKRKIMGENAAKLLQL